MVSNVQTAAHIIQDLDIGLDVYYMDNGNDMQMHSLMQLASISTLKIIIMLI